MDEADFPNVLDMERDGRTLDHRTLEEIRLMAVRRVREGESAATTMAGPPAHSGIPGDHRSRGLHWTLARSVTNPSHAAANIERSFLLEPFRVGSTASVAAPVFSGAPGTPAMNDRSDRQRFILRKLTAAWLPATPAAILLSASLSWILVHQS
ncbi:hypothetical protein [Methylibium sp.]|uniref:hypothetical protein n=1 Tax=Methylibium sp. TaxID=2067992 RepID=UPI003D128455